MKYSRKNASHFIWGDRCDGWWLLQTGKFTVIEEMIPAGACEKEHFHQETDQFFYCLEGQLTIQHNNQKSFLVAGEGLFMQAGKSHKVINSSVSPVRFLVISCPDAHKDRIDLE